MTASPNSFTRFTSFSLAMVMLLQGSLLRAADPTDAIRIQDVQLREGGVLTTRVVDAQGNAVVGEQVIVEFKGKQIASSVSDSDGLVAVSGLRPGLHAIVTSMGTTTACRFWAEGSAPPSAVSVPAVVSDAEVVRGQFGAFNLPQIIYGGVAIAALILAVDANNTANDSEDAAAALAARVKALEDASP